VEQPPQQPPQPPQPPEPQPWGGRPWGRPQPPQPPPAPRPWGEPPAPRQPWGYRPPPSPAGPPPPGGPRPWYRHPVGLLLIAAVVLIVLVVVVPIFTGGGTAPTPTVTSGNFVPPTTAPPAATTTSGAPSAADALRQAIQAELGEAGQVTSVVLAPGGQVVVTWEIRPAGSRGLTVNNARFGVMRIMRAIQQSQVAAGGNAPTVRLLGRYQLPGSAAPVTVVRLRFDPATVKAADFDDRRYLEAFKLADAATIHPAFRG
jgi:hypothetical protein